MACSEDPNSNSSQTPKGPTEEADNVNTSVGDDFDEFEQGDEVEDFGAFDEGNQTSFDPAIEPSKSALPVHYEPPVSFDITSNSILSFSCCCGLNFLRVVLTVNQR